MPTRIPRSQVRPLLDDPTERTAGGVEHPPPEGHDGAGPLGGRQERDRRQQSLARVLPAHECLHPLEVPVAHADDRLERQPELVEGHGASQLGIEEVHLPDLGIDRPVVVRHLVLALALRPP
jgi:hypothetical protein